MEETEQHITALPRCAASLQERFAGRRRTIEVALGFGDESKDAQRVDRQPDLSLRVEARDTRVGGWRRVIEPPQRRQVPGDDQVVQGQLPAVYRRFQQIVRLAQRVERSPELVCAHKHRGVEHQCLRSTNPIVAGRQRGDRLFAFEHSRRWA